MAERFFQHNRVTKAEIMQWLSASGSHVEKLYHYSSETKLQHVGNRVFLRGLIELSNACGKDCFYCGIRHSNTLTLRYTLSESEVTEALQFAYKNGYGSVAIQSGEIQSMNFTEKITRILKESRKISGGNLGVTLSCGEQTADTYQKWFENGADRYLLRIESSNKELYQKIHPQDGNHSFEKRIEALKKLKSIGFQVGTGIMIGLPFQTLSDLADDLIFMKELNIDMCGMGPYIEHCDTPLYSFASMLLPLEERLNLSYKMIALLRILMPDINIAATTALQAVRQNARMKAIQIGANVLMPNITPKKYRENYYLYNKPFSEKSDEEDLKELSNCLREINHEIGFFEQGNSKHFSSKNLNLGKVSSNFKI